MICMSFESTFFSFNPIALRKAKIVYNFGLFECKRVIAKEKDPLKCMPCLPLSFSETVSLNKMEKKV